MSPAYLVQFDLLTRTLSLSLGERHDVPFCSLYGGRRVSLYAMVLAVLQSAQICIARWYALMHFCNLVILTTTTGIVFVVIGQILRSSAMIHAAVSFSHTVASRKLADHTLVTDGIYASVILYAMESLVLT